MLANLPLKMEDPLPVVSGAIYMIIVITIIRIQGKENP